MLLRALSKCLLNTERVGASTASLGSLFQCLSTLLVRKCFLRPSLNLPWRSFEPFPCVLSLDTREKTSAHPSPLPLLRQLQRAMTLPISFLFSKLEKPRVLTGHYFQPFHQLCCLHLGTFKDLNLLLKL